MGVIVIALRDDLPLVAVIAGAVVCVAAAVYLAFLGWRLGVVCDGEGIEVHGLLRSRRIPRDAIVAITNFPAVRWKTVDGKSHWTPIFAFANPGRVVPFVERHNEAAISILQNWLADKRPEPPKKKRRQRPTR
ncbi:PH domain-containing protein [Streptomyces sp. SID13031]|uniref:PH domain-containing protein n=1 Tax=Streptomyces sp. SID13031 TaxID=2706046 RepID=UPI001945641F|nr:PH domain-containing protein [Streptomyces sp. SID13031]